MKTGYRLAGAIIAWTGLILQYIVIVQSGQYPSVGASTLAFIGYFTVTTNVLVALAFTAPLLASTGKLHSFFVRPPVRAAIALYIVVVAIVFHTMLAQLFDFEGMAAVANLIVHTAVPVLFVIDWLVIAEKRPMRYKHLPYWVIYPLVYGSFTIVRGLLTGAYPYPFLDVNALGLVNVFINLAGFIALFAVGGAVFITIGRALSKAAEK